MSRCRGRLPTSTFRELELPLKGVYSPVRPPSRLLRAGPRRAVSYDRVTGYFRRLLLAIAADGVSRFLANGGRMRLIVGAELAEDDVRRREAASRCSAAGSPAAEPGRSRRATASPSTASRRSRWLVREGRLEMKVGVPLTIWVGRCGATSGDRYFHTKYGILTDADGDPGRVRRLRQRVRRRVARNHETFTVPCGRPDVGSAGRSLCAPIRGPLDRQA